MATKAKPSVLTTEDVRRILWVDNLYFLLPSNFRGGQRAAFAALGRYLAEHVRGNYGRVKSGQRKAKGKRKAKGQKNEAWEMFTTGLERGRRLGATARIMIWNEKRKRWERKPKD